MQSDNIFIFEGLSYSIPEIEPLDYGSQDLQNYKKKGGIYVPHHLNLYHMLTYVSYADQRLGLVSVQKSEPYSKRTLIFGNGLDYKLGPLILRSLILFRNSYFENSISASL